MATHTVSQPFLAFSSHPNLRPIQLNILQPLEQQGLLDRYAETSHLAEKAKDTGPAGGFSFARIVGRSPALTHAHRH